VSTAIGVSSNRQDHVGANAILGILVASCSVKAIIADLVAL